MTRWVGSAGENVSADFQQPEVHLERQERGLIPIYGAGGLESIAVEEVYERLMERDAD